MNFDPGIFEWLLGSLAMLGGLPLMGILGALSKLGGSDKTKLVTHTKSQDVQESAIDSLKRQRRYDAANEADINALSPIYRNLYDQQAPQAAEGSRALYSLGNRIAGQAGVNDPLSYYRQMGDYATGKIGDFANKAIGYVPASIKLLAARAGAPMSSYINRQVTNNVFSRTIPYVSQLLSNIGSQAGSLYGAESARINQIPGLYSQAAGLPFMATRYLTQPIALRGQAGSQNANILALLQRTEDANNIRGVQPDKNIWDRLGESEQAFLDTAGQAAGIAGNIMGGFMGGGGGGLGGLFGGGGGSPAVRHPPQQPTMWASPEYA